MLPTHTADGLLPEGIHVATWAEVVERFGGSDRRALLLGAIVDALVHLREAGCETVYFGGSFVTTKLQPKDIDVVWTVENVDPEMVHRMFLDPWDGRQATLSLFGAEFFPSFIIEGDSRKPFVEFFQTTRDGQPAGVVAIDLSTLEE